jgi:hypothetical protein
MKRVERESRDTSGGCLLSEEVQVRQTSCSVLYRAG